MGGARCSYRACTSKSDQKTHMFHFPVFDKIRCHQWITNAHKLNFLDLKLSQLKNRVICEHHFTDDCFMNIMRGKLTMTAVPTLDGPFCPKRATEKEDRENPINLDDIENDYLTNMEKKAHFSVKYVDFLTNDVTEPIETNLKEIHPITPSYKTSIRIQDKGLVLNRRSNKYIYFHKTLDTPCNSEKNRANDIKEMNIADTEKITISDLVPSLPCKQLPDPKLVAIEFDELNLADENKKPGEALAANPPGQLTIFPSQNMDPATQTMQHFGLFTTLPSHKLKHSTMPIPLSKKVKIISEKKISEPVTVKGELQPILPSNLLKVPDRRKKPNVEMNGTEIETFYFNVSNLEEVGNIQGYNNSNIISSQPDVTNQIYSLNEYNNNNSMSLVNQFEGPSTLHVQNELLTDNKPSEANYDSLQFKQDSELMTATAAASTVPNVDFVSTTINDPSLLTLPSDVPQYSTLLTGSTNVHNVPTEPTVTQNASVLSTDLETLSGISLSTEQASGVSINKNDVSGMFKTTQDVALNKKLPILPSSPNKTVLRSRMPPEKLVAIEQKRKYNMKLRDIINSCLNKLNEEPHVKKTISAATKSKLGDKKVDQHLSEDPNLPTSQENNIAYFEARLQRMEDTLLNKIEQNSQRIIDLKRTLKVPSGKRSAYTQTCVNAETTKKNLYQQISQFLSPEANSKIYEELFLSSYNDNSSIESHKKRKRRI